MTLRLSDDEAEALRLPAERESRSIQDVARQAVREYIETHSRASCSTDSSMRSPPLRRGTGAARSLIYLDGNKRPELAATIAFLGVNGRPLTLTNDQAYELIMAVAEGQLTEIAELAARLGEGSRTG